MILWFLRRFFQFRHLEALEVRYKSQEGVIRYLRKQCEHKDEQIEALTQRNAEAKDWAHDLVGLLEESRKSEIKSTQTVADFVSQMKYGKKIYDHVPELPDLTANVPEMVRVGKQQASDVVKEAERKFVEAMRLQNQHQDQPQSIAAQGWGTQ